MPTSRMFLIAIAAIFFATSAQAQERESQEKGSIGELELGVANEWTAPGGGSAIGPSMQADLEAIRDYLEIEIGTSPLLDRSNRTEWDWELVFKTPIYSRGNIDITAGLGPEWQHQIGGGNSAGTEAVVDFQFWRPDRKIGWFFEPSYSRPFSGGQSVAMTVGLLIALP
jgi:hypothetical protein